MKLGPMEIALIVLAVVLIFGVGKLGQIGGALGRSIREFRKEKDKNEAAGTTAIESKGQGATGQLESGKERFCPNCGEKMSANAKFCMGCGAKTEDFGCKSAQS